MFTNLNKFTKDNFTNEFHAVPCNNNLKMVQIESTSIIMNISKTNNKKKMVQLLIALN